MKLTFTFVVFIKTSCYLTLDLLTFSVSLRPYKHDLGGPGVQLYLDLEETWVDSPSRRRGDDALMCCESAKSAQLVLFSLILLMKSSANRIIFSPHQAERKKKVLTFKIPADLYVRPFSL